MKSAARILMLVLLTAAPALAQRVRMIQDIAPGTASSSPTSFAKLGGYVYFSTYNGPRFARTDGTTGGVSAIGDNFMEGPVVVGSQIFFAVTDTGKELWHFDPAVGLQQMVKDINPGWAGSDPSAMTSALGRLFFAADDGVHGKELWVSDGTDAGTFLVRDINSNGSSNPRDFVELNGVVYFAADDDSGAWKLWRTDGTYNGTLPVANMSLGKPAFDQPLMVAYDGNLYFSGTTSDRGTELWRTDGTIPGTVLVADILPGTASSFPAGGTVALDRLFFYANNPATGWEPYVYDAATQSVSLIKDVNPGTGSSYPALWVELNGAVLFQADDGTHCGEVWRTDGTAAGTWLLNDTAPGPACGGFQGGMRVGNHVYFSANTPANGYELWMTDGTTQGTNLLADIVPGSGSSYPSGFVSLNDTTLLFDATTASSGTELWALDLCEPTITASGPTAICGTGDSVVLTASEGLSYLWSTGATSQSIAVSVPGTYTVRVTSANGCSEASGPVSVTLKPLPSVTVSTSAPTTFCAGGSVTLTAGGGTSYVWSNGATTPSTTVSASGSYSVTVTNADGCSVTSQPIAVTVNPLPTATIAADGPTTFCSGGNVTLTAPAGYTYLWSNGATTQSINVSQSGTYAVTVTDANGCANTSTPAIVNVNPLPQATITAGGPTTFCEGGSVMLTATPGMNAYLWSNGATTQSIIVTDSGTSSVTVTNANGCSATSSPSVVTVNALPVPAIAASGPTTFCAGGSVTLTASGGTSYRWSNDATTPSITVTDSGSYFVTATDANGCSATSAPIPVTANALPAPTIAAGGPTTFCEGGSVTLTASAGASYLWSNGATTQSITVTQSGSYSATVTDADGCSATTTASIVTINPLPTPVITANGPTTFCAGGSVTLTASAGASYLWSNGATTQSITVNQSGSFSVAVTNANGCSAGSALTTITVNQPPAATITANGPTTFCAGGSVTLTASPGASYLWSNGAITQSITVSQSGSYSVTLTNGNGCSATSPATSVTVNPLPTAAITAGGPTTFCEGGSVTLTASAASSYLWSNGAATQSITVNQSGSFSVAVTNANGCSATSAPTTVSVNPLPTPVITAGGPTTFCEGSSVTLTASSGASYLWSNGAATQSITVNQSGSFSVVVTNANGCTAASAPTVVTVNANPTAPVITAGGPTTFCAGGSVTLTAPAANAYLWSNGATTQSIVATAAGSFSVSVTNASGCSASSSPVVVTVNALPIATITAGGPTTFCAGGNVTLSAPAGMASYNWSNGATTQSIIVSASGSYSVTVTNAAGCTAASAPTVVSVNANPATPVITAGGPTTFCAGGSVTLAAPAGMSSYLWSNGATTPSIVVTTAGSYSVTVWNASNCGASSAPTVVTVNSSPVVGIPTPVSQTVQRNKAVTKITATASGNGILLYQWFRVDGTTYTAVTSLSTTNGGYKPSSSTRGTFTYILRVTAQSTGCTTDSAPATLTVT